MTTERGAAGAPAAPRTFIGVPAHVLVMLAASTAGYALMLAAVTGLQSQNEAVLDCRPAAGRRWRRAAPGRPRRPHDDPGCRAVRLQRDGRSVRRRGRLARHPDLEARGPVVARRRDRWRQSVDAGRGQAAGGAHLRRHGSKLDDAGHDGRVRRREVGAVPVATVGPELVRREGRALASPLRLTVSGGASEAAIERAWAAIEAEFAAVDAAMSRYREDSEITRLNRAGSLAAPSRRLVAALTAADRAGRITGGLFDARVVRDLERLGSIGVPQSPPAPGVATDAAGAGAGAAAPYQVGRPLLRRAGRRGVITLLAPVDLGGIGKGLALRWAARRAAATLEPRLPPRGRGRHRVARVVRRGPLVDRNRGSRGRSGPDRRVRPGARPGDRDIVDPARPLARPCSVGLSTT